MDAEKGSGNRIESDTTGSSHLWRNSLLIILFASAVFLVIRVNLLTDTLETLREDYQMMQTRIDSLRALRTPPPDSLGFTGFLTEYDLRQLREKGLVNPVEALKTDLMNSAELIPEEGVLGGTMHFYPDQIYVLSSKWVLAYYDDGHTAGELLLEYKVSPTGEIAWNVIDSN
ncbi:MAG: hypothetical protein K9N46_14090 [Candidatus Marinimicrobia bacterium]|nr:hypothetical protein [Candidatus Neomarinimicrobiota bacterium]MCF7829987.1 hypothetical protein [Candidatus Neomarinimicrobiota bacterium]MCF7881859.1 hypothetical protein [Candidatus Neomarinimicrobiota bacterium]